MSTDTIDRDLLRGMVQKYRNQPATRTCLNCGEPFSSSSPGERICPKCATLRRYAKSASRTYKMKTGTGPLGSVETVERVVNKLLTEQYEADTITTSMRRCFRNFKIFAATLPTQTIEAGGHDVRTVRDILQELLHSYDKITTQIEEVLASLQPN